MKKYAYILASALAFAACNKEGNEVNNPIADPATNNNVEVTDPQVHELFVSIQEVVDADTKAAITEGTGAFTWAEGDHIAVKTTTNDVYQFTAASGGASVRFTYTGEMNGTPQEVKYPYTADFSDTALPTEIASLTGALGADAIRLAGTVSENSVFLAHQHAFMRVTFNDVPTFASSIVFDGNVNDVTISFTPLGSKGQVVAYIPVAATTTSYSVSLKDNSSNHNIIIQRSSTGKSFTAGRLKNMRAVKVGNIVTLTDNSGWTSSADPNLYVFNDTNNFIAKPGNAYPYKLNRLDDGTLYVVMPYLEASWTSYGNNVKLKFQTDPYIGEHTSQTDCYAIYRDLDIEVPAGGGMKAAYRFYVYMSDSQWDIWKTPGSGTTVVKFTTWEGISTPVTNAVQERNADNNGYIFYHQFNVSDYGKTTVKYRFYNEHNAGWESKNESGVTLNCDIWGSNL